MIYLVIALVTAAIYAVDWNAKFGFALDMVALFLFAGLLWPLSLPVALITYLRRTKTS